VTFRDESFESPKESGIWKHRRRSPAVWTAAVPEDDLITAKALTAHSADQRQVTNLQFAAGFVSRPPFRSVAVGVPAVYKIYRVDSWPVLAIPW
jgi:hypothetical protein